MKRSPLKFGVLLCLIQHCIYFLQMCYISSVLFIMTIVYSLYCHGLQISMIKGSLTWLFKFTELHLTVILAYERTINNLEHLLFSIPHAGDGVFTMNSIGAKQSIRYYYGALLYENMSVDSFHRPSVYAEASMVASVKDFTKWSLQGQFQTSSN